MQVLPIALWFVFWSCLIATTTLILGFTALFAHYVLGVLGFV